MENDYGLTFEVTRRVFGEVMNHSLVPGGASIPVTMDNRWAGLGRWIVSQLMLDLYVCTYTLSLLLYLYGVFCIILVEMYVPFGEGVM